MDTEFHYWMTGILARAAGFDEAEAQVIAYAAEYVDENDVCLQVLERRTGKHYRNFVSQTMNILKPRNELMRIYPIFHFVPGQPDAQSARRCDGKMHLLNCTPASENGNAFMDEAFKAPPETRLYRIGIAAHAYADTWAHQNFVGVYDSFNALTATSPLGVGHMDASFHPDWPGHVWRDPRLVEQEVDNTARLLAAAKSLYSKFCGYLAGQGREDRRAQWPALERDLDRAMSPPFSGTDNLHLERRLASYRALAPWLLPFDERHWFEAAVETRVRGLRDSNDGIASLLTVFQDEHRFREDVEPQSTHWFRFQQAVKAHERLGLRLLSPIFHNMGQQLATM